MTGKSRNERVPLPARRLQRRRPALAAGARHAVNGFPGQRLSGRRGRGRRGTGRGEGGPGARRKPLGAAGGTGTGHTTAGRLPPFVLRPGAVRPPRCPPSPAGTRPEATGRRRALPARRGGPSAPPPSFPRSRAGPGPAGRAAPPPPLRRAARPAPSHPSCQSPRPRPRDPRCGV